MNEKYNYCQVVGRTDVGQKRSANEDNMHTTVTRNGLVAVVCDGMGGHVGGATASSIAVTTIVEFLDRTFYDDPHIAISEAIDCANQAIIEKTQEQPSLTGMGSTCVVLLVRNGKVYLGHVGDSRIYLVRSRRIIQLTKDHSYVQTLVDSGEITKEQAEMHPRRNEITNALGIPNMAPATLSEAIIPEAGDCFVLCSDGLSGMVSDEAICKVVSRQTELPAQTRVNHLVDLANANGGLDNITVQIVEFAASPAAMVKRKGMPLFLKFGIASLVVAVLGVGAYFAYNHFTAEPKVDDTTSSTEDVTNSYEQYSFPEKKGETIPFKAKGEIVTLEYADSALILKRGGKEIKKIDKCFDRSKFILSADSEGKVKVDNDNSTINFKNVHPGNYVKFTIEYQTETGEFKEYKFQFKIKPLKKGVEDKPEGNSKGDGANITFPGLPHNGVVDGEDADKDADKDKDSEVGPQLPDDFKKIFTYTGDFSEKTGLILSYGKGKFGCKVNNTECTEESQSEEEMPELVVRYTDTEAIQHDTDKWEKLQQLGDKATFQFIGDVTTGDNTFEFVISCETKDGKNPVTVKIILKQKSNGIVERVETEVKKESPEKKEGSPESSDKKDESAIFYTDGTK